MSVYIVFNVVHNNVKDFLNNAHVHNLDNRN